LSLGCVPPQARATEAQKSVQALIVFDVSGSMRQSDPNRLSVAAAQLFSNLSQPGDAVGLTAFSDRAVGLMPVTSREEANTQETLQRHLTSLQFNGRTTNLVAALEAGLAAFPDQEDSSHRRLVLLLTDGKLDLGKQREKEEAAARTRIVHSLIPDYRRRDISLYTIAFTSAADRGFLEEMAEASAGESLFIANAQTLHQAFARIFIGAHDEESFPLDQGNIRIDASIKELSLVFAKSTPGEHIALLTPQLRKVQANDTPAGTTWQSTPAYELVHMREPQPGTWQVDRSGDVQSGVGIIAESTLSLRVELGSAFIEAGAPFALRAFLQDESQTPARIRHDDTQTITAEVSATGQPLVNLTLAAQADGSFSVATPVLLAAGKYSMTVTATAPTLQRQRTRTFEVHRECLQGSVTQAAPIRVRLALHSSCPSFENLSIEANYTAADKSKLQVPLHATQPGLFEADLPVAPAGQRAYVDLVVRGENPGEGTFTLIKGPWPLPVAAPAVAVNKRDVAVSAGRTLLKINAGLVLLGALGYAMYRAALRLKGGSWKKP
jgi:Mg-chelatase subunit ChlD